MTAEQFQEYLDSIHACAEARQWTQGMTLEQAWKKCNDIGWMEFLLKASVDTWFSDKTRKSILKAAAKYCWHEYGLYYDIYEPSRKEMRKVCNSLRAVTEIVDWEE